MYMTITYHWEDMVVNRECDTGDIAPHTRKEIMDIDYDYEVNYTIEDIIEYLLPYKMKDKTEKENAKYFMKKAIEFLENNGCVDYDSLQDDSAFYDFLKERYENKALEQFQEENEAY